MSTVTQNYDSTTSSNDITITLASLATSSSMVAGRESTIVDNTSNKFVDVTVTGQITTGTTPTTAKTIAIYAYTPIDLNSTTYVYPVATTTALTGADAAATFEAEQRNMLKLGAAITVNATSDRKYSFQFSVAQLFGGIMPLKWGLWVTHDTAVNLNATGGNHWITYTGIKYDIA
jgi:hypothetical protein